MVDLAPSMAAWLALAHWTHNTSITPVKTPDNQWSGLPSMGRPIGNDMRSAPHFGELNHEPVHDSINDLVDDSTMVLPPSDFNYALAALTDAHGCKGVLVSNVDNLMCADSTDTSQLLKSIEEKTGYALKVGQRLPDGTAVLTVDDRPVLTKAEGQRLVTALRRTNLLGDVTMNEPVFPAAWLEGLVGETHKRRARDSHSRAADLVNCTWPEDTIPSDPMFAEQRALYDRDVGINLGETRFVTRGAGVNVAVLDNGIALPLHEDLAPEKFGRGGNVVEKDGNPEERPCDPWPGLPFGAYHGSAVATVIGAQEGNDLGMVGVAPDATIVPVRAIDCWAFASDIAAALYEAVDEHDAHVINMSLGSVGQCPDVVQNALNHGVESGAVPVAAAGTMFPHAKWVWPANCDNVLTVGAVSNEGERLTGTGYGGNVDVMAPGEKLVAGYFGKEYGTFSYSSAATALASGVVALLKSVKPDASFQSIVQTIRDTSRPHIKECDQCGAGLLDAGAALKAIRA